MEVGETSHFKKSIKKLRPNEKAILDEAVETIMNDLSVGKVLKGRFVTEILTYRPKKMPQYRLIYSYDEQSDTLTLWEFENRAKVYKKLSRNPYSI